MHGRLIEILRETLAGISNDQALVLPSSGASSNFRTQILRLCERAGVEPYPKLLQNLRLSCETDWMDSDGIALACKWSGNTPEVAMKHYHLVRESDYKRVADRGAEYSAERCKSEGNRTETAQTQTPASVGSSVAYCSVPFNSLAGVSALVPPRGVEHPELLDKFQFFVSNFIEFWIQPLSLSFGTLETRWRSEEQKSV